MWYRFSQQQILPPVHDGCNCYIEQMPGGNSIWQFRGNTCEKCKALGREYNQKQNSIVNEPAQMKPIIPEPPAIIEEPAEQEPIEEQVEESEEGVAPEVQPMKFMNYKYTPKKFYNL